MATKKIESAEGVKSEAVVETVRRFKNSDPILCKSNVNGPLYITGKRSEIPYRFADYGDISEIEYQDLIYMIRSRDVSIFDPRIIILDDDFVNQNRELESLYESMYSNQDYYKIIELPIAQMKKAIAEMPSGSREVLKGIAATMIENRSLDSVQKIKALDEIFNTKLLFTLVQE